MMNKLKSYLPVPSTSEELRQWLLTYVIILSYLVFATMGVIIAKYNPIVINYIDYMFMPIGLATILFIYIFALTYEKKIELRLTEDVLNCVKLYGEGKSFETIKNELNLRNVNEVKRMLTEFCKFRS